MTMDREVAFAENRKFITELKDLPQPGTTCEVSGTRQEQGKFRKRMVVGYSQDCLFVCLQARDGGWPYVEKLSDCAFRSEPDSVSVTMAPQPEWPTPVQADQWDRQMRGDKMSAATGRVIFKYQMPVQEHFTMRLPAGADIVRVDAENGMFWLWAMIRTDVPDEVRQFRAFKCGGAIPDDLQLKYVGRCALFIQQELMLYIYEEITNA